jgi:uncharacterized protein (UPF0261 family)
MPKSILLIGAFDSKGEEYAFVRERILEHGCGVLAVNTGIRGSTDLFPVDVEADAVASAAGRRLEDLRTKADRGEAIHAMCAGSAAVALRLFKEGRIDGVLGMGGSGGTAVVTAAMRALPIGFPKLCVSTIASGDTSPWVGTRDVVMMPSVVDVAGINRVSRVILGLAAGAICGMAQASQTAPARSGAARGGKTVVAVTMFGNTTPCVDRCRKSLEASGCEVLVFHATGTGGRTMEGLVAEGWIDAVLDITTTEWADEICGGVLSAGPERLDAAGKAGLPHLIVPGCIDMCNFAGLETVPPKYKDRRFHEWNPSVTLMRTNADENRRMGEIFAGKAGAARGPVAFLIPRGGFSILDSVNDRGEPQPFWDPDADRAFVDGLRSRLRPGIEVIEMDAGINDPKFADRAVGILMDLIARAGKRTVK